MIKEDLKSLLKPLKRASDSLMCCLMSFAEAVSLIYSNPSLGLYTAGEG